MYRDDYKRWLDTELEDAALTAELQAIADKITDTYTREKALDVLTTVLEGNALTVSVAECPAVKHLRATGREVSPWYRYTTEVVMSVLAEKGGFRFAMESYETSSAGRTSE